MKSSLIAAVSRTTGESCSTIRQRGFTRLKVHPHRHRSRTSLAVGLICPGCGEPLPLLQQPGDELPELAECLRCDAFYPYDNDELQVLDAIPLPLLEQPLIEAIAVPA